jgi:hypothetical protein
MKTAHTPRAGAKTTSEMNFLLESVLRHTLISASTSRLTQIRVSLNFDEQARIAGERTPLQRRQL